MDELTEISKKYDTDKSKEHQYTKIYNKYFFKKKNQEIKLFEIGIGYPEDPQKGGGSLQMWRDYFPKGIIYGIDIVIKNLDLGERVKIYQGSQDNHQDLNKVVNDAGKFDIIIDDGSHFNNHQIKTFEHLFKFLNFGGYYVIEDTQTSYMLKYGGDGFYLKNKKTAVNYFKDFIDRINFREIENPYNKFKNDEFSSSITEIHFYHNLIIIKKDFNKEPSNLLTENQFKVKGKSAIGIRNILKQMKYFFHFLRSIINKFLDILKI